MQELIRNLPELNVYQSRNLALFDTCFFIDLFERSQHAKVDFPFAMTSFNAEELLHNIHKLGPVTKEAIRHFLKNSNQISILKIPVHPGNSLSEKYFIELIEPALLATVPDPSDGVLMAAAIQTKSNVFTKDRHHLYTAELENFVQRYNINVWKELKDKV